MRILRNLTALIAMALLTAAMLTLVGCGGDGGEDAEVPFEDTYWVCSSYAADGDLVDVLTDSHMDIVFESSQTAGSSGCNRYSGVYTLDGNAITIGPLISTMMGCEDSLMEQETAYLAAIQSAAEFDIEGTKLKLLDADGAEIAIYEADMSPLTGQQWLCTGYNNGKQAVVSVAVETSITLEFAENGKTNGSSGCNTYNSEYEIDDEGAMMLSQIAVTEMFCASPEGIMVQEEAYLGALMTVAEYEIRGTSLTLRTADGAAAATFTRP